MFDVVGDGTYLDRVEHIMWAYAEDEAQILPCAQCPHIVPVPWVVVTVDETFEKGLEGYLKSCETTGYEGVIIRRLDLPYEHKRSVQLLKLKTFQDEEFVIVGSETGTPGSDKDGLLVCFICSVSGCLKDIPEPFPYGELERLIKARKVFKAPLCGSEQLLREMWQRRDSDVGELATVMFQEETKYGVPRFPKVKGIRGREDLS